MKPAVYEDRTWVEARLRERIATSMFPLSNLARHGWESAAPHGVGFWLDRSCGAVLGMTNEGMLMPQAPDHDFAGAAEALAGRSAIGVLGEASQVRLLLAALGLAACAAKIDEDQPQFVLNLTDLAVPEGIGSLVPLSSVDPDLTTGWRATYLQETIGEDAESAARQAADAMPGHAADDTYRVLVDGDGNPLAMTGLNARLPGMVQVGGVYTPPERRGGGLARRAVALHLAELRDEGVERATLFASGPAAVKAYEAIGFRPVGLFSLVLFRSPERIGG